MKKVRTKKEMGTKGGFIWAAGALIALGVMWISSGDHNLMIKGFIALAGAGAIVFAREYLKKYWDIDIENPNNASEEPGEFK